MFHDAPVESLVTVHRRPRRHTRERMDRLTTEYQLPRIIDYIVNREALFLRVALQFPDELLEDATLVSQQLEVLLHQDSRFAAMQARLEANHSGSQSSCGCPSGGGEVRQKSPSVAASCGPMANPNAPTTTRFVVLADTTFGSCCPDEITAQHYHCDCLVHFGEACMSKSTRLPVLYIHTPFHFSVMASASWCQQGPAHDLTTAAALVHRVLTRATHVLAKRKALLEKEGGDVAPRLVVVSPHAAHDILCSAQDMWQNTTEGAVIPVDWCIQECRGGSDVSNANRCGIENQSLTWVVNGVRFPRQPPADCHTVQYFLFVGPSNSPHLVHLLSVHEYNMYHYTESQREFFDNCGDEDVEVPVVSVLDETFGMPGGDTPRRHTTESATTVVDYVDAVLEDRGLATLCTSGIAVAYSRLQKRLRQRCFNIEAVRASSAVGILVASLAIQGYYEITMLLHQLLRAYGKRSYIIYVGHLNEFKLANFVDTVDCFVAIACPNSRSSHFPERTDAYLKPVVSPVEVLLALTAEGACSPQYGIASAYSTAFDLMIPTLTCALQERQDAVTAATADPSAAPKDPLWQESAALIQMSSTGGGALTVAGSSQGALARLQERSFIGLDPQIGQTAVQRELVDGRHGIARGYATEREEQAKNVA